MANSSCNNATSLGNHYAQNLIQTNGNILINDSQNITFSSDLLNVNDGLTVEDGGEFIYFNDPCEMANRNFNKGINVRGSLGTVKKMKSYNYQIDEDNLICNFELNEPEEVSIEIVDENGKTIEHDFGMKQSGKNQIILSNEKLPKGEFLVCLKIGFDRYHSRSSRK